MRYQVRILLAMICAAVLIPLANAQGPIKIGAILPLSGAGASYGVWMKGGIELAVDEINAAGGIAGRKLEVVYEDHAADASKAVNAMRRLVDVEKVPFTFISYSSPTLACQPIAAQNKVVMMNGGGQSDNLANKDYLYNNIPAVSNEIGVLANWLYKDKKFRSAVVMVANDEAGRNAANSFRTVFHALGGNVLAEEQASLDGTDFRGQLAKLRAADADVLVLAMYGRAVAIVADQAREIGITIPMASTSAALIPETFKSKGAQGLLVTRLPFDPTTPFAKKFKERYKTDAGFYAVQYYNGTKIFARAAEEAIKKSGGKLDGEGIKNAIESIRAFDTISGRLVFQPNHNALMDIEVGVVKGGTFHVEKTIKAAH